MTPAGVRDFLARHGLAARRDLGQNFLHDARLAARLAESSGATAGESVIEIGTGLGILTRALAERAGRVVTVEVDAGLVRALREDALLPAGVELLHADALELDLAALAARLPAPVRVVANLPYSVASPLLRRLLSLRGRLCGWSVLIQKEVAARVGAAPGQRDYGSLAVLHQLCVRVKVGLDLRPGCFYPVPRVVSTFLHIDPLGDALLCGSSLEEVERVARASFAHRRKTLQNSLREALGLPPERVSAALEACGIAERARAQDLAPAEFVALTRELNLPPQTSG